MNILAAHFAKRNMKNCSNEKEKVPKPARIPPQTPPAGGKRAEAGRIQNPRQIVPPCLVQIEAPPPARILGGQNTKEKCPFLFRRNWSRANPKSKEHFSLVSAEALRGGGGAIHSRSKKVRANDIMTPPTSLFAERMGL
jgi:hypothetical protein